MKKWEEALRKVMKMCILLPEKGQQCTTRGYTPEKVRRSCLAYLFQHSQIMSCDSVAADGRNLLAVGNFVCGVRSVDIFADYRG